jgi:DNA-binding transcriptional ArsR family regulator
MVSRDRTANGESPTPHERADQPGQTDVYDRTFAALSDATRRDILVRLARGPASISELAAPYDMSLTGLKKHVKILEAAELVTTEKVGRVRHCRLGPRHLEDAEQWIEFYRREWTRRLTGLEAYFERKKENDTV